MKKTILLVILAFILGVIFLPRGENVVLADAAMVPNRLQLHAKLVLPDGYRSISAYCDTGNGVMVYIGEGNLTSSSGPSPSVAVVPNGCKVK